jgi:hypothetical protein
MSMPSSLIKRYVSNNVPQEDLQHAMHKWIKRYWKALPAKDRAQVRIDLQNNRAIFSDIPVVVRTADGAITLDWSEPGRKANKKKHGKLLYWKKPLKTTKEKKKPAAAKKEAKEAIPVGKKVVAAKSTKKKPKTISTKKKTSSKKQKKAKVTAKKKEE